MIVRFNGVLERSSGGCIPCGSKRVSKMQMLTKKVFILPSGTTKTFYVGREEEVGDKDGQFLLSYQYTDKDGAKKPVFTEVK